jgi:type I restriction enzyme S subunit
MRTESNHPRMINDIPNGWTKTTLREVTRPLSSRVMPSQEQDLPYIGLEHVEPHSMKLTHSGSAKEVKSSSNRFSKGDVLYGKMRPYLNKVWVAEFDGLCSTEFLVFPKQDGLQSAFLAYRLNASDFVGFANGLVNGERPRVDFDKIASFPILLPPDAEQKRIVAKLNDGLSAIERAKSAASRAMQRIEDYRNAVSHFAVSGKLTQQWREHQKENSTDKTDLKSGSGVLREILELRRTRWEAAEIQNSLGKSTATRKSSIAQQYPQPIAPDVQNVPAIPDGWAWASLEMVADIGSGISVSQSRIIRDAVEVPYLRVANVLRGRLDLAVIKQMRIERAQLPQFRLRDGDILFNEGGDRDKVGRGWIWENQIEDCVHQNHVFRASLLDRDSLDPRFVSYWGNTFGQQFFIEHATQTTNLASINRGVLSRLPVPVPPKSEQIEIMRLLSGRIASADRLNDKLALQVSKSRSVREGLLNSAFSGRLVPQDDADESASVWLSRAESNREDRFNDRKKVRRMSKRPTSAVSSQRRNLLIVLAESGRSMTPEQLFTESGYSQDTVDDFFAELRLLTSQPAKIKESRDARGRVFLKVVA